MVEILASLLIWLAFSGLMLWLAMGPFLGYCDSIWFFRAIPISAVIAVSFLL